MCERLQGSPDRGASNRLERCRARAPDGDLDRAVRVRPSVRAPSRTCIEPQKPASLRYARRLMRRGDSRVLLIAAVLTIATGLLDYLTPVEVDFTPFYMVPVVPTACVLGWKAGLAFGVVGAVTEFVADDVMRGLVLATALWNGLSRIGVFFALAVVTDRFHLERSRRNPPMTASAFAGRWST